MAYIRRQQPTPAADRAPQELDLNLKSLREEAFSNLLNNLRESLKAFDEIDALDRMLQRQVEKTATTAAVAAQAHTNGTNGHGRTGRPPGIVEHKARKGSAGVHASVEEMEARKRAALEILRATGTGGITTVEFMEELRDRRVFPKSHLTLRSSVRKLMMPLIRQKQVIAIRGEGRHAEMKYFLAVPRPAHKPTKQSKPLTTAQTQQERAALTRVKKKSASSVGDGLSMRQLVTDALMKFPAGATPAAVTEVLLKDGIPPKRGKSGLNLHVNWALGALAERGRASKRQVAGKPVYTLKRPSIAVTKSDTASET
jgi:hypothetical protein